MQQKSHKRSSRTFWQFSSSTHNAARIDRISVPIAHAKHNGKCSHFFICYAIILISKKIYYFWRRTTAVQWLCSMLFRTHTKNAHTAIILSANYIHICSFIYIRVLKCNEKMMPFLHHTQSWQCGKAIHDSIINLFDFMQTLMFMYITLLIMIVLWWRLIFIDSAWMKTGKLLNDSERLVKYVRNTHLISTITECGRIWLIKHQLMNVVGNDTLCGL